MTQNVTVSRESRFSVQPGSSTTSRHADAHQRIHAPVAGAKRRGGIGLARCMLAVHPQGLQVRPLRRLERRAYGRGRFVGAGDGVLPGLLRIFRGLVLRPEEQTSEFTSLMRTTHDVYCLKTTTIHTQTRLAT